jgi:MFS family permease
MGSRHTERIGRRGASAGSRVLLAFVSLVIAPIAGLWVAARLPNPAGEGPGVWQVVFGGGVPAALVLLTAALARVGKLEAFCWLLAAIIALLGLLLLIAQLAAQIAD